jgi:hypothetical protein
MEGKTCLEPWDDQANIIKLYQVLQGKDEHIEPNVGGDLHLGIPMSMG